MREYDFPALCAPEAWRERLTERVREEQAIQLARKEAGEPWAKLKLTWWGELGFDLRMTERETHSVFGKRAELGPHGASLTAGAFFETRAGFSETFRGRFVPGDWGGSVLRGRFRLLGPSSIFLTIFGLLCAAFAVVTPLSWLGLPLAAVLLFWHLRHQDSYPASQAILTFLAETARRPEDDLKQENR